MSKRSNIISSLKEKFRLFIQTKIAILDQKYHNKDKFIQKIKIIKVKTGLRSNFHIKK